MKSMFGNQWESEESVKPITIKELPILITDGGDLVCIPNSMDEPTIGVSGMKGKGKTHLLHSFLDRVHHYWDKDIFVGNDSMNETLTWNEPNQDTVQVGQLGLLQETPKPMPMVYCAPMLSDQLDVSGYLNLSLPAQEVFANPEKYFDLGKSRAYFNLISKELQGKTKEEMIEFINNKKDLNINVRGKLIALLSDLFSSGVLDTGGNAVSNVRVAQGKQYLGEYSLIGGLLRAGLIPSLLTGEILEKKLLFPSYLAYWFNKVYDNQINDPYFKTRAVWAFVDELKDFYRYGDNALTDVIDKIVRRGRPARFGFCYATQFYDKIPAEIRVNTTYTFTFGYKNSEQIRAVCGDHDLEKYYEKIIRELSHFKVLACTSEKFVIYNKEGERKTTSAPQVGTTFPTLSLHKKPTKVK